MAFEPTSYLHAKENRDIYLSFLEQKEACRYSSTLSLQFLNQIELTDFQKSHLFGCSQCQKEASEAQAKHKNYQLFYQSLDGKVEVPSFKQNPSIKETPITTQRRGFKNILMSFAQVLIKMEFIVGVSLFLVLFYFVLKYYAI